MVRQIEDAVDLVAERLDREPAILSWPGGLPLAAAFRDLAVFSPPTDDDATLPYLDAP